MKRFVLNDEAKINSYGFRVINAGIDLTRFNANPVMLNQHENTTSSIIGQWKDLKIEGSKLTAEAVFDMEDTQTNILAGKVERGFIKGASMGLSFGQRDMIKGKDGIYQLTKCQLLEASICAIPSNENSLSLYAKDGHKLTSKEISIQLSNHKKNTSNMDLLQTLIEMLELPSDANEDDVINAVQNMLDLSKEEKDRKVDEMLNLAVREYNLDHTERGFWEDAAKKDFESVEKILLAPGKKRVRLSQMVTNKSGVENRILWTLEDYRKKAPDALKNDPALFKRLLEKEKLNS